MYIIRRAMGQPDPHVVEVGEPLGQIQPSIMYPRAPQIVTLKLGMHILLNFFSQLIGPFSI